MCAPLPVGDHFDRSTTYGVAAWREALCAQAAYRKVVPELTRGDFENLLAFRNGLRRFLHWSKTQAREAGLTPAQHQLLVAIKGHPGDEPPTISDLAGYLLLRHHSVVELVDRAAAAGLVERQADPRDGRVTRISLTADGEHRLRQLAATHLDELRNLAPVLDQLVAGWEAEIARSAAPGSRRPAE
jgi:DNA-binding MarR family transcriptional regulator